MRSEPFVFQWAAAELLQSDDFVRQAVAHVTIVLDGICLGSSAVPVLRTQPVASSSPMAGSRLGLENYWRRQQPFLARAHWQQTSFCDVIPRSQKCSITYTPTEAQSIHMHSQHSSAADADQVPALRGHGQAARPGRHGAHQRSRSFRKQSHTLCKLSFKLENNPEHAAHAAGLREQILRRLNPRCSRTTRNACAKPVTTSTNGKAWLWLGCPTSAPVNCFRGTIAPAQSQLKLQHQSRQTD